MQPNPYLKILGFSEKDRVAIIHADDIGMSQATLPAIADLFDFGLVSSAAIMVPCPWYQGAVTHAVEDPELDYGVHLTLNSEWDSFRWGPISTKDPQSGLLDEQGYFFNSTAPTAEGAYLPALRAELQAQLNRAHADGLRITHADTHMFCLGHPRLIREYIVAALAASTLPVLMRPGSAGWHKFGFDENRDGFEIIAQVEAKGLPMLDDFYMMNLDTHEDRLAEAKQAFEALEPGFTHFILHPAIESPELKMMAPDWRCRTADLDLFLSEALLRHVKFLGIQVIGYEMLRAAMPHVETV